MCIMYDFGGCLLIPLSGYYRDARVHKSSSFLGVYSGILSLALVNDAVFEDVCLVNP